MDERLKSTPVITIVGRPNVGKSTLFNRLLEAKKALTSPEAGTTRDLKYGHFSWRDLVMTAIDTAGLDLTKELATEESLKRQAQAAIYKADLIVFLADVKDGMLPQDRALIQYLRKSKKPVIFAVNKADNPHLRRGAMNGDWLKLGLGEPHAISAANGSGVGDLLDVVVEELKARGLTSKELPPIDARLAIIGRPNVGKSTLLNALAGEERVIVSEIAHTTKEPQDTFLSFEQDGRTWNFVIVDTVGIRKRAKVEYGLERIGVDLSLKELDQADIVFLVIDATAGLEAQEKKLAGLIEETRAGVITVINKWDVVEDKKMTDASKYREYARDILPFMEWSPVTFISAKTGSHVQRLLGYAVEVLANRRREVSTEELDKFVENLKKRHSNFFAKGGNRPKIYGITQVGTVPPTFQMVVKDEKVLHDNFTRFVKKAIRERFGFEGTPIRLFAREIVKGRVTAQVETAKPRSKRIQRKKQSKGQGRLPTRH